MMLHPPTFKSQAKGGKIKHHKVIRASLNKSRRTESVKPNFLRHLNYIQHDAAAHSIHRDLGTHRPDRRVFEGSPPTGGHPGRTDTPVLLRPPQPSTLSNSKSLSGQFCLPTPARFKAKRSLCNTRPPDSHVHLTRTGFENKTHGTQKLLNTPKNTKLLKLRQLLPSREDAGTFTQPQDHGEEPRLNLLSSLQEHQGPPCPPQGLGAAAAPGTAEPCPRPPTPVTTAEPAAEQTPC